MVQIIQAIFSVCQSNSKYSSSLDTPFQQKPVSLIDWFIFILKHNSIRWNFFMCHLIELGFLQIKNFWLKWSVLFLVFQKNPQSYAAWAEVIPNINGYVLKQQYLPARVWPVTYLSLKILRLAITISSLVHYGGQRLPLINTSSIPKVWTDI